MVLNIRIFKHFPVTLWYVPLQNNLCVVLFLGWGGMWVKTKTLVLVPIWKLFCSPSTHVANTFVEDGILCLGQCNLSVSLKKLSRKNSWSQFVWLWYFYSISLELTVKILHFCLDILPSTASTQLNSTSISIEAEILWILLSL